MRETIELAREVDPVTKLLLDKKLPQGMDHDVFMWFLERFEALVRADEREQALAAQPAPVQNRSALTLDRQMTFGGCPFCGSQSCVAGQCRSATPPAQPAPTVQEPVGTYGEIFESMLSLLRTGLQRDQQIYMEMKDKPLYTTPPAQPASEEDMKVYRAIADNYRKDLAAAPEKGQP
jgi:hypothetical protein